MDKKGLMLALGAALVSGISVFLNALAVKESNPFVFSFLKNAIVAVFLFSIIILFKEFENIKELTKKQWAKLLLIGTVGGSIPFLLFFQGLKLTTGSAGSFIQKTMFVYVLFLGVFFLKEKIDKKVVVGAALLLIGNLLFLGFSGELFNIGNLLVLAATLFWAAETAISKKALKELSPSTVAFGRMFFGSLIMMGFLIATNQFSAIFSITASQMIWTAALTIPLLLYVSLWYSGLQKLKASTAAAILLIGSPITALLSFIFINKAITAAQIAGTLFLAAGIFLILNIKLTNPLLHNERA